MSEEIGAKIVDWYELNKRDLPWRKTKDPYKIWLSEVILQQTRVAQGTAYYEHFVEHYPTVYHLANASQDSVLRSWQGLGYYSRARNLHFAANQVITEFNGKFPVEYSELRKLKGVGEYTAAAIASICSDEKVAVVDGNVYRVLTRIFNIHTPIDSTTGKKEFAAMANELIKPHQPSVFNQAMMEFGALQCTPKNPGCVICPLQQQCESLQNGTVLQLPVKSKKVKVRKRFFTYLFITDGKQVLIRQRGPKDIWQGLYEPYLIESEEAATISILEKWLGQNELEPESIKTQESLDHILTHQKINANWHRLNVKSMPTLEGYKAYPLAKLDGLAKPKLIERFLEKEIEENK